MFVVNASSKELTQYEQQLKAHQHNPYAAGAKLKELDGLDKPKKTERLLKGPEVQDIFSNMKTADGEPYGQLQQLVGAGEAGIALVTPQDTHQD